MSDELIAVWVRPLQGEDERKPIMMGMVYVIEGDAIRTTKDRWTYEAAAQHLHQAYEVEYDWALKEMCNKEYRGKIVFYFSRAPKQPQVYQHKPES